MRRAFGSRAVALLATVFLLTDGGNSDIGGWFWLIEAGVWTAGLGFIPALLATARVAALLEEPTPATAATIGLLVGLALLCHPIHLIYFGVALPLVYACHYLCGAETAWRRALSLLRLRSHAAH